MTSSQFDFREENITLPTVTLKEDTMSQISDRITKAYNYAIELRRKNTIEVAEKFAKEGYMKTHDEIIKNLNFLSGVNEQYSDVNKNNESTLNTIYEKLKHMENLPKEKLDEFGAALVGTYEDKQIIEEIQDSAREIGHKLKGYNEAADVEFYTSPQGWTHGTSKKSSKDQQNIKESLILDEVLRRPYSNALLDEALEIIRSSRASDLIEKMMKLEDKMYDEFDFEVIDEFSELEDMYGVAIYQSTPDGLPRYTGKRANEKDRVKLGELNSYVSSMYERVSLSGFGGIYTGNLGSITLDSKDGKITAVLTPKESTYIIVGDNGDKLKDVFYKTLRVCRFF